MVLHDSACLLKKIDVTNKGILVEPSFSRFLYLDTNIFGVLAQEKSLVRPLFDFLWERDLCLAISGAQAAELSDAQHLHEDLDVIMTALPSVLVKSAEVILDEEVRSYPNERKDSLISFYMNALFGTNKMLDFLSSDSLRAARQAQKESAALMPERHTQLKKNFPPQDSGKYIWEQAPTFAWIHSAQCLAESHRDFMLGFKNTTHQFKPECFRSIQIYGYALFYKYYLHGKEPKPSDFGDMFHLAPIPYCKLAVMERDMCNVLNHIKSHHDVLKGVTIKNIDFFKEWEWNEE